MTESISGNTPMAVRIREFDPSGQVVQAAAKVAKLIDERMSEVGDAAHAKMLEINSGLHIPRHDEELMRAASRGYYADMLRDLSGDKWHNNLSSFMRTTLADPAGREKYSLRQHMICVNAAFDTLRSLVMEATEDGDERAEMLDAVRTIRLINVDFIYETYTGAILETLQDTRDTERQAFSELLTSQIDKAATLGEHLRDQAREASFATRGMLDKASEVAAAAEQSAIAMREAAHTSSGLIRAIEEARSEVDQAADVASRASQQAGEAVEMSSALSDHAQSIESILGLIRDIAGQTNLLALNATIEAARAGDAGRGFAVVAQEVKSLASQTARATDDIAQKIAAIQNATRQSVDTNDRIRATVQEVQTMGLRIRSAMDAQSQTVTMITAAVDETALAADSMSSNISAIRQDTEIVASEIDALETGFSEVQDHLGGLRDKSENFVASVGSLTKPGTAAAA